VRGAFPDALLDVLRREAPGFRHVRGNHPVQPGEVGFLAVPLHQALRLPLVLLHRVVLRAIAAQRPFPAPLGAFPFLLGRCPVWVLLDAF
jgi:hypothetical protein